MTRVRSEVQSLNPRKVFNEEFSFKLQLKSSHRIAAGLECHRLLVIPVWYTSGKEALHGLVKGALHIMTYSLVKPFSKRQTSLVHCTVYKVVASDPTNKTILIFKLTMLIQLQAKLLI